MPAGNAKRFPQARQIPQPGVVVVCESSYTIGVFVDLLVVEEKAQPLLADIDGCTEVLVDSLGRHDELFPEDVQNSIAANETNEVVSPRFWFR